MFDLKLSLSVSSKPLIALLTGEYPMNEKLDEAIKRGLESRRTQDALNQSTDNQSAAFWSKLKMAVERGVERINQIPESTRLAGGELTFASKSETEFNI